MCWWCKIKPAMEGDTLCIDCWGCKSAGLTLEECLEDDDHEIRAKSTEELEGLKKQLIDQIKSGDFTRSHEDYLIVVCEELGQRVYE